MAKQNLSLLEEQVNYLLEEGNEGESTADTETADSGANKTYTDSLKALQESKKRLLKAQDESEGDTSKKIKSALDSVDSAIKAVQQEMDGDEDEDDKDKKKEVAEEGKGKKKKLQQNSDGDDKPKGDDEDKPKEEGKGKKKLQKNEDGDDEPSFGGSEDDLNEESDDNDEDDDEEGNVEEEGKGKKKK